MCDQLVGKGAVQYRCRIEPEGHDGPCAAPESGPSMIARKRWEVESKPLEGATVVVAQQPVKFTFMTEEDRVAELLQSLRGSSESLPPGVQSWIMGASATVALHQLWEAWKQVKQAGGLDLALSEEDIVALIPSRFRV